MSIKDLLNSQQSLENQIDAQGSRVKTARVTPVNAVAASVTILATEIAQMSNGDTITFDEVELTKASSTSAEDGEFSNIAGVRSCIDALLTDWVSSGTTNATATRATKGLAWNDIEATYSILEATTASGDGSNPSVATIASAMLGVMAAGDTVTFASTVMTKVASSPGALEWTNAVELAALIGAITGWDAAESSGAVNITAAANGAGNNGQTVVVTMTRATSGGVNGTTGLKDQIVADASYLYVCTADNTVNGANWKRVSLGSAY